VRNLAQPSSWAAKDIKGLITNSNTRVQDGVGVELVNKAGTALSEIIEPIYQVATICGRANGGPVGPTQVVLGVNTDPDWTEF